MSSAIVTTSTSEHLFSGVRIRRITFEDLKLVGPGPSSGSADAIHLTGPSAYAVFDCVFRNLFITNFGRYGIYGEDFCGTVFDHVRIETCGTDGFHLVDNSSSGLGGTSCTFTSCYANACGRYGYYLHAVAYSTLISCSTDACTVGYVVDLCTAITFDACGVESTESHGFCIYNGSTSINLNSCYALNIDATGSGFRVAANGGGNCSRILFNCCRVLGSTVPTYSMQVESANQATCIAFQRHPSAANATTGTVNYISDENTGNSTLAADLIIGTLGKGIQIKNGTNARIGTASLAAGTVTIANTSITANTRVFAMSYNIVGTPGFLAMSGRVVGTSFTITSYTGTGSVNNLDTSSFSWILFETV